MAPVRSYTNWNSRTTDEEEQIEPYRKYFFICEGANTETWYFKKLIDIRKELNIHPLIDIRLLEKTEGDRDISSQSELRLPLLQVVSSNKYFSVGVQSPTEINAPRGRTLSGRQWFCADRNGV